MTKQDFIKNYINGDFELPRVGHFRIEKKNGYFVSFHELDSEKKSLVVYKTFDDLWKSKINGKLFSDFVESMADIISYDDDYNKEEIERTGKLFV